MGKIKVFKFGGASVKDASAVKNLLKILNNRLQENLVVVISAMGKTTNNLEKILFSRYSNILYEDQVEALFDYHFEILSSLNLQDTPTETSLRNYIKSLKQILQGDINDSNYDFYYDQIISLGELISTTIVADFLILNNLPITWVNAKSIIKTDATYREGKVNWETTISATKATLQPLLADQKIILTQGFIGSTADGHTTTLGREGSDYTAAILAHCLEAIDVTIWKDVPGVLNADPKRIKEAKLYSRLSYDEAAEMTFYGASVIHPKTIRPLAVKNIPLLVKSFLHPDDTGTIISQSSDHEDIPAIIIKDRQTLVSFKTRDFSFINETHLHKIFESLSLLNIKINLMQNSAVSFSISIDDAPIKLEKLMETLQSDFQIRYNTDLQLITIKNYRDTLIQDFTNQAEVLMEQRTRNTCQIVLSRSIL
ncbi:aspartate kinase [Penaeicola halotolerans]|uniref:aspartate kinase n=1 Tax=Penaeicola halotolerans TaxID=2793196 RepID=UPI001CF81299|nr:aspartate kinase [Penaeicola halotolerans]